MSFDIAALLAPISDTAPGGEDARSSDAYDLVSSEIDKLTSISGGAPIDWKLVEQQGAQILATQSKDFMLAAWVSAAWMERHGLDGLKAGLELHAGLIEAYWDNGFPPLKRVRGRRNALAWWVDRAERWLENHTPPAMDAATHTTMVDAAGRIDQGLAERDPESAPLGGFVRQIKNLEVLPEETAEEAPETAAAEGDDGAVDGNESSAGSAGSAAGRGTDGTGGSAGAGAGGTGSSGDASAQKAGGNAGANAAISARGNATAPAQAAAIPAANFARTDLGSLDDIVNALQPVRDHLAHICHALMEIAPFNPLLIEINRFAARAALLDTPPANGGNTALMPPPVAIADAFAHITGSGNAEGMIAFCESRIPSFPFWLDLDYQSARGYGMMGEAGAPMRQAVIKNALAFTERLPGLEELNFSDGTPFANEETRQWLQACRAQQASDAASEDAFAALHATASAAANDGRHAEAMQHYHDWIQHTFSRRDQFRARIALLELLMATHGDIDPLPLAQPLIHDCTTLNLADWEPELAAKAWQMILKVCRHGLAQPAVMDDAARRQQYLQLRHEALQQLARVDFPAATRLST